MEMGKEMLARQTSMGMVSAEYRRSVEVIMRANLKQASPCFELDIKIKIQRLLSHRDDVTVSATHALEASQQSLLLRDFH